MWQTARMRLSVNRLFAALPDAITAALFLTAWIAPRMLGAQYVKDLMLVMLMEFIVMHSSGFYAGLAAADSLSRGRRLLILCAFTVFYMVFIVGFALGFQSTWPIFAFLWLFASRFAHIWLQPQQGDEASARALLLWAVSGITYILGALLTVLLPLPPLGLTPDFVSTMQFSANTSGEWITRPWTVTAFGTLYFSVQAYAKYKLAVVPLKPAAANRYAS